MERKYKARIFLNLPNACEIFQAKITFYISKGWKATLWEPGEETSVEIISVFDECVDLTGDLSYSDLNYIEDRILREIDNNTLEFY